MFHAVRHYTESLLSVKIFLRSDCMKCYQFIVNMQHKSGTMRMWCANVFKDKHEIDECYNAQSFELTFNVSNGLLHIQNGSCKTKYLHVYKNKKKSFYLHKHHLM